MLTVSLAFIAGFIASSICVMVLAWLCVRRDEKNALHSHLPRKYEGTTGQRWHPV